MQDGFRNSKGSKILTKWTGIMGYTVDGLPIVGKVPSRISGRKLESGSGAEWVGAGFCGHGMAYGWLTGKALAEMVLKGEENIGDWFPREEFACSEERLQRISLEDAVAFFLETVSWRCRIRGLREIRRIVILSCRGSILSTFLFGQNLLLCRISGLGCKSHNLVTKRPVSVLPFDSIYKPIMYIISPPIILILRLGRESPNKEENSPSQPLSKNIFILRKNKSEPARIRSVFLSRMQKHTLIE